MIFPLDGRKASKSSDLSDAIGATEAVKSFGHRYLRQDALILVSLGSMDTRKKIEPVALQLPFTDAQPAPLDGALSLVVSASGASGDPAIFDLPVRHNVSVEPISFRATDISKVQLLFDIVPALAGSAGPVLGRGVALLSSIRPVIGSRRCSLQGDTSVPIVEAGTLQVIGSVHFNFLVITPFDHPNLATNENLTYWKSTDSTMVIGHRGDFHAQAPWALVLA
jgi:glycerophosphodiester phosphodiesterase